MSAPTEAPDRRGAFFWVGLVLGTGVMIYGLKGMIGAEAATQPTNLAKFFIGAGIVHDAVFAPIVVLFGWLTLKVVPPVGRTPVRLALAASIILIVFTWPMVRGWGVRSANDSLLPFNYGRNLVIGLVVIWLVAMAEVARRVYVQRRHQP